MHYSHLEDYIQHIYKSIKISSPSQLNMTTIAERLGIQVSYGNVSFRINDEIILRRGTKEQQWQEFGHEVCHYLRHCGNQLSMHPLFFELQEYQANNFSYHFCVPTFMLLKQKNFNTLSIARTFNVTESFASRRLEIYQQNHIYGSNSHLNQIL
ncbi:MULTISPECIES: ImmA/IrrE family metallo-endopeptidase [Oceanobacillus]|uniref:Phage-like element PBSX protein XkdA n=1 Tax=Oceanobacillus kimchii TaxID=746691 RepID=A0ABQ5TE68_9BACI|nr:MULTISPECIES: ImmA/IrrE family metallo-endopeptidase [Oceanobacillus]MBT2653272.1 ImmA/IrrE family metallo-endopeptidase [Oceanobacillus sp. ISL-73]MCT1577893.1 ImmA/IrrE family metallo-endopeptidase [Oceanobacillus kimchii]MCT2136881.1 ImmA/IrrE family metallo-endopeptidase [Oceanobacillus kimchii]OEH53971.1 terminase [Oceanobacillus sp. E9]GLO64396.1 phage-like element PBSX protein XkdA [Oceanobacillus kimchii]